MECCEGKLLYGSLLSEKLKRQMKEEVEGYRANGLRVPRLDTILVGDDPSSLSYIRGKKKACEVVGIENVVHHLPADISQKGLEDVIFACNQNDACDGILLQMPLPTTL